jgi:3-oxoacyl-[acyl-carrier protein] reductase
MNIKGTTAIITGAAGKVGRVIALKLAAVGCDCVCHYNKNKAVATDIVEQIQSMGRNAVAVEADLVCEDQIPKLFDVPQGFGDIKILINSASVFPRKKLSGITIKNAREILDINLIAQVMVCREFEKIWVHPAPQDLVGKIVNLVDVGGIKGWAEYSIYCASKAGLIGATKALAKELAPDITVNAVAPGVISMPEGGEEELKRQLKYVPMNRLGKPEEVAAAVLFLLGNDYVTGQVLCVDGGRGM